VAGVERDRDQTGDVGAVGAVRARFAAVAAVTLAAAGIVVRAVIVGARRGVRRRC